MRRRVFRWRVVFRIAVLTLGTAFHSTIGVLRFKLVPHVGYDLTRFAKGRLLPRVVSSVAKTYTQRCSQAANRQLSMRR